MSDRDEIWDMIKAQKKAKFDADRAAFLAKAQADDDGGWTKHTAYHWSRSINGWKLDYWPTRRKYMMAGWNAPQRGDVMRFIRSITGGK